MNNNVFAVISREPEPVAVQFGRDLLCSALPSPLELSFASEVSALRILWQQSQLQWREQNLQDAVSILMTAQQSPDFMRPFKIPTLFLAAHLQVHANDAAQAHRCIQAAVRIYAEDTGLSSSKSTREAATPNAMGGREWLILAISSLLRGDLKSCLMWMHQAERELQPEQARKPTQHRLQLQGDLHAILACVAATSNELSESEKALAIAYQSHVEAESFRSASRDLLLTARLSQLQNQRSRALSLLDAAECQLLLELSPQEFDSCSLVPVIQNDRVQLTLRDQAMAASLWN